MSEAPDTPFAPERPSHPDYARLQEIVLQLDGATGEDRGSVAEIIAGIIDDWSLVHTAFGRSLKASATGSANRITVGAGIYVEAFVAGYRFRDRYGGEGNGGQHQD